MHKVTVLIPLGPKPIYRQYIKEAVQSVLDQSYQVDEILVVDDGANITDQEMHEWFDVIRDANFEFSHITTNGKAIFWYSNIRNLPVVGIYRLPCNLGFISAFNVGMAVAENELVMYLASDDTLAPTAVADCVEAYEANNENDAWYSLTYSDAGRVDDTPINCAMLSKNLWAYLGGYPPAAFAGPDAALLSIMMIHLPDRIIRVAQGKVNYFIKHHSEQETKVTAQPYSEEMTSIRNKLTLNFKPREGVTLK